MRVLRSLAAGAVAGILFGGFFFVLFAVLMDPLFGLMAGAAAGILFGGGMALFFILFRTVMSKSPVLEQDGKRADLLEGETIIHQGPANHFKGWESVGGHLYLTDRRLRFRSHAINVQVHDETYPRERIRQATPRLTMGIVPNGILVTFHDGEQERFVVQNRAEWLRQLNRWLAAK